jgi:hypothetical protein
MSDIVERLRYRYPELEMDTDRQSVGWEAAEEIERLRARNARLIEVITKYLSHQYSQQEGPQDIFRRALEGKQ